jgi:hypothetical protein
MNEQIIEVISSLQKFSSTVKNIHHFANKYAETMEDFAINLNWFIYPKIKIIELKKLINLKHDENQNEIDTLMIKYMNETLDEIESDIKENFSNRCSLINEIFIAHKNKLYSLSIISCFAQIDGIVFDKFKDNNYFNQLDKLKKDLYKTSTITEENTLLNKSFQLLLNEQLPIKMSKFKRGQDFKKLNRHQVIHGEKIDYNNEINSLKAISFLALISFLFSKIE